MRNIRRRTVRTLLGALLAGAFLEIGGCSLGDAVTFVRDFNPCLSILACDPVSYRFLTSGYDGPGVDPDIDPACTYPPFCNVVNPGSDPFSP